MTREKIISLARELGFIPSRVSEDWIRVVEAFYHAAQTEAFEAAAKLCDEQYPYSVHHTDQRAAKNCAAAIREMAKEIMKCY